jgi:hypothetical protein
VVLVSTAAVVGYVVSDLTAAVAHNSVQLEGGPTTAPDIGAYKNGFNLLVVGIDACEPKYADLFPGRCDGPDVEREQRRDRAHARLKLPAPHHGRELPARHDRARAVVHGEGRHERVRAERRPDQHDL